MTGLASLSLIGSVTIFMGFGLLAFLAGAVAFDGAVSLWRARQLRRMARNLKGKNNGRFHTGK